MLYSICNICYSWSHKKFFHRFRLQKKFIFYITCFWNIWLIPFLSKVVSGDDDLPKRDDISERRRKHELRVLAGAGIKTEDDDDDDQMGDLGSHEVADEEEDVESGDSENEFYKQVEQLRAAKLAAKAATYSRWSFGTLLPWLFSLIWYRESFYFSIFFNVKIKIVLLLQELSGPLFARDCGREAPYLFPGSYLICQVFNLIVHMFLQICWVFTLLPIWYDVDGEEQGTNSKSQ